MGNFLFLGGLLGILLGIIFLIYSFFSKKYISKKKIVNKIALALFITIMGFILLPTADEDHTATSSSTTRTSYENTKIENQQTTENINNFKKFLENNNQDFGNFVEQYYSINPTSDQSKVFDKLIRNKKFTFTGTVIEPMNHRVAIIANNKFNNESWTTSVSATPLASYVIFVKNIEDTSQFSIGDQVVFSGTMSSPGANLSSMHAQWDMNNGEITKI
ncbi:DUF3221 domain-containing protein [Enterococcus durans]|uniref:DUF3221 domain-containing protein n=1 Tax=Enterococcus durans TaxID=53345 RepID=UPI0012480A75|nr:DUF3221 domain-containing protein [Enterococcus durans]KAA9177484.1 DUF3221 domain-containing protein [Enterococcus durans]KAA9214016.1 DUF3221 domain-containing protein [Enterococcus durans]